MRWYVTLRHRGVACLSVVLLLGIALSPEIAHHHARAAGANYYAETGHTLSGPIRTYWNTHGGLWMFGYPISEPYPVRAETGEMIVAQYFERARLEYHPSLEGTPYRVLGGLLGNDLTLNRRSEDAFQRHNLADLTLGKDCTFFAATGHSMCAPFSTWWEDEGGLPIFGYPISQPFHEDGYLVQYYERARFEWHPEFANTRWEVELGLLGRTEARQYHLLQQPAFERRAPRTTTVRVATTLRSDPGGSVIATIPANAMVSIVGGPQQDSYLVSVGSTTGWVPFGDLRWTVSSNPNTALTRSLTTYDPALGALVASIRSDISVGIWDPRENVVYQGGASGPVAGASLSKVLLLAIALKEAERDGTELPGDVRATLEIMIEESDNDAANTIWEYIGGYDAVMDFLTENDVSGFSVPDQWDWGQISASGGSWARFMGRLGSGQLLSPEDTAWALELMHRVIGDHRWGVLTPGENLLSIGKNGWYPDDDPFIWRVNGAGFIDTSEDRVGIAPLVVVVMSAYPGEWGMNWGVDTAAQITQLVVDRAAGEWSASYLGDDVSATRAPASLSRTRHPVSWRLQNR